MIETPELVINSKSPGVTPAMINKVMEDAGYVVTEVTEETLQETPEETAAAETAAREAQEATEQAAADAAEQAAEKERKTRGEKRREARERDAQAIKDATERAERLQREVEELRTAQSATNAQIEDLRKNPPKAEPEPEAPKRPVRPKASDFFTAEDPDAAFEAATEKYEDNLLDYADARKDFQQKQAEKAKPKVEAKPVVTESAAAQPKQADLSDDAFLKADIGPEAVKEPTLRRFFGSVRAITESHPGAYKAIVDNIANVNDAIIQAGHSFDQPARVALYLAQHPEESKRIKALTDGNTKEDPTLLRKAFDELGKIEQLAAEEDAATHGTGGSGDEAPPDEELDPENDLAAATISKQPQRPGAQQRPPEVAKPKAPAPPKKHTPVQPVGARGTQIAKSYNEMTEAELRLLSSDEVRKLRGML